MADLLNPAATITTGQVTSIPGFANRVTYSTGGSLNLVRSLSIAEVEAAGFTFSKVRRNKLSEKTIAERGLPAGSLGEPYLFLEDQKEAFAPKNEQGQPAAFKIYINNGNAKNLLLQLGNKISKSRHEIQVYDITGGLDKGKKLVSLGLKGESINNSAEFAE